MKKLLFAATLAILALLPPVAMAGVTLQQIPGTGAAAYVKLPDGTYGVMAGDINGAPKSGLATLTPLGYGKITATSAVKGLADVPTIAIPTGATIAWIEPEGADVRFRDDGSDPTTSVGKRLEDGATLIYAGDLTAIKLIAQSGTAAFNVLFYK